MFDYIKITSVKTYQNQQRKRKVSSWMAILTGSY